MDHPTTSRQLQCVVVTPERTVLDEGADFVALPMYDGELGVLPERAPLIGRLGSGELRLMQGGVPRRYYVDGGFAQVRDNVVTVLTSKAVKAEEINRDQLNREMEKARQPAATPEAREAQQQALAKARAQLRVAEKTGSSGVSSH